jgi:bla regulator protein blaR1
MNALPVYMFKAALYLSAFYLIYFLFLSRDTTYSRNRAFILISVAAAMILPDLTISTSNFRDLPFFGKYLADVLVLPASAGAEKLRLPAFSAFQVLNIVYLAGVLFFALKLIVDLMNLLYLINRQKNKESRIIRIHGFNTSGFSAMGYVFINNRIEPREAEEIIRHEQNHLKRNHFIDIIFLEVIRAFQWFNPAIYLFNRSLRAIHEYQADQGCLTSGIPVVNYQSILLNQVFRTNTFTLTNSFSNPSLIKNRMLMMTRKRTSSLANMKLLFVIPVVGFVFLSVSAFTNAGMAASQVQGEEVPYLSVDQMPAFPGGDQALLDYIGSNTIYPENAKIRGVQGRIVLKFCIEADGKVNRVSVIKSIDPDLDSEAIRVVNSLPPFIPGKLAGRAVPVWFMVPITFSLK